MKFFLDTANLDEIRDVASTGILDGITTNPSLISKEGNMFEDQLLKICSIVKGPVSAETVSPDAAGKVYRCGHLHHAGQSLRPIDETSPHGQGRGAVPERLGEGTCYKVVQ